MEGRKVRATGARRRPWRLFRPAQPRRSRAVSIAFPIAYVALAALAYNFSTTIGGLAVLWLCNGLLAVALLLLSPRWAVLTAAVGFATDFACSVGVGHGSPGQSALIAALDLLEAIAMAVLARRFCGAAVDVTRLRRLAALVLAAILPATLTAGTLGALVTYETGQSPFFDQWLAWAGGDILGMLIAAPAALIIARLDRYGDPPGLQARTVLIIVGLGLLTAAVFGQDKVQAFALLVLMSMLFLAFVMSPAGVMAAVVLVAVVASAFTIAGHGPVAQSQISNPGHRILVLQLFLASVTVSALGATALVAEWARARGSLLRSLAAARDARRRADAAAAVKARFLSIVSHEMRTPLNAVLGQAEAVARRPDLPPGAAEPVDKIRNAAKALSVLIDDVIDVSEFEAHSARLEPIRANVAQTVHAVAAMAGTLVGSKPITVRAEVAAADGTADHLFDARRLTQVLTHFASNAIKFSDAGEVVLRASMSPGPGGVDLWRISVLDRGVGVPEDKRELIFQPFTQADASTTRRHGGAGLGLALCRALAERMGGAVGVRPRPGGGSEFWLDLPAARVEAVATAPAEPAAPADGPPVRVLVVDDHVINLEVARMYLEALGCDVACCESGAAAVEAVAAGGYDLVFMDLHMPGLDGFATTRAIRALPAPAGATPVVALTAAATSADVAACLEAGMQGHLAKPISSARLADALVRYAQAPACPAAAA